MESLALVFGAFAAYLLAYHTYGRYVSRCIFQLDPAAPVPSRAQRDDQDFIPTHRNVLFGHHFTTIAGLGPIVGPALAIIWGWVPALLWILFGSIFMGAVHDFGALVVSLRNRGRSIGDLAADLVNARVRVLFLLIIFFVLLVVIAIFALIIAILFQMYPEAVLPVWLQIPIALALGHLVYARHHNHVALGLAALVLMYASVALGVWQPLRLDDAWLAHWKLTPTTLWMGVLFVYAYVASTLPVQRLLQPRDYINGHQLFVAMALLVAGVVATRPALVAPPYVAAPAGAPSLWPTLFVVIACGAVSGFHCLASSGTTSKQCAAEPDARFIGYGGMLLEGALAVLVLAAVGAGLGLGLEVESGTVLTGSAAFQHHYANWTAAAGLPAKLGAFVTGARNLITPLGIPADYAAAIMGVFIVSFAATTLDSATRIQRYVVSELAGSVGWSGLAKRHPATLVAVLTAFALAFSNGDGKGAMRLWPVFGCINQLLAGLALLILTVYLARRRAPVAVTAIPMAFMLVMTGWALVLKITEFYSAANWLLFFLSLVVALLECWMLVESALILRRLRAAPPAAP